MVKIFLNENQAVWPEEIMKNIINSYPEITEYSGSLKQISGDDKGNAIILVVFKELSLSFVAVIKNKELMPLNVVIKDGEIINITKENKEFVFSDFNTSNGVSDVNSREADVSDFNIINESIKEVRDIDDNFLGYTPAFGRNNFIPGTGIIGDYGMMGMPVNDLVMGYGDIFNKYAKLNRMDFEEIVVDMLKESSLKDSIFVADAINESSKNEIILPIETPVIKVAFDKKSDKIYGKSYKYAGKSTMNIKNKELDSDDEEEIKPQIHSTLIKAINNESNELGENESETPPIGKITVTRIIKNTNRIT